MILALDPQGWAHLSGALRAHTLWCRDNGISVPPDIGALREIARAHNRERSEPTSVGDSGELHAALMQAKVAVTYAETADRLGVSKRTVERLVKRGELPAVNIGGAPRIRIADLEDYVASVEVWSVKPCDTLDVNGE